MRNGEPQRRDSLRPGRARSPDSTAQFGSVGVIDTSENGLLAVEIILIPDLAG
jgi:hypothetical protein